jgi:hypothetical protein
VVLSTLVYLTLKAEGITCFPSLGSRADSGRRNTGFHITRLSVISPFPLLLSFSAVSYSECTSNIAHPRVKSRRERLLF